MCSLYHGVRLFSIIFLHHGIRLFSIIFFKHKEATISKVHEKRNCIDSVTTSSFSELLNMLRN